MKNMRVLLSAHPYPPLSSTICYLLTQIKSPLFYLIKSKSYDQDARCSIYDNFSHFITYVVDFFIQGQISNLLNARHRASTILKMSSAFSLSPISGRSSKKTVLKRWFLMLLSCNVKAKWFSRGAVFFNEVALYNFTSVPKLMTTALGI